MPVTRDSDSTGVDASVLSEADTEEESIEDKVLNWLNLDEIGLRGVNPFVPWDADDDPNLKNYLVQHDVFREIWQDSPAVVFAHAGGGKTTFRVRLTHACRVEEDDRQVFAIPYISPRATTKSLERHLHALLRGAAHELLLRLLYRPERLLMLDNKAQDAVRRALEQNAPGLVDRFAPQIERSGSLDPLAKTFDRSAIRLPAAPSPDRVRVACAILREPPPPGPAQSPDGRFREFCDLVLRTLRFEAIYVLVDGVDAFFETVEDPGQALQVLQPLLDQMEELASRQIFLKLFLPIELYKTMPSLTEPTKIAIIGWKSDSLSSVLRARLLSGSKGQFDSLDAISAPSLRDAESMLIQAVPPVPRELLVLANQVIVEHARRVGARGELEVEDVNAAISWYRRLKPQVSSP